MSDRVDEGHDHPEDDGPREPTSAANWWAMVASGDDEQVTPVEDPLTSVDGDSDPGASWIPPPPVEQPESTLPPPYAPATPAMSTDAVVDPQSIQQSWLAQPRTEPVPVLHPQPPSDVAGDPAAPPPPQDSPQFEPDAPEKPRRSRVRRSTYLAIGVLVLSVAVFVIAFKASIRERTLFDPTAMVVDTGGTEVADADTALPSVIDLPDVVGLETDRAEEVLTDAGVDPATVKITEAEWASPAGVVVRQSPAPGSNDPESVELTVSVPAEMPDLTAVAETDAVDQLRSLGVLVDVDYQFVAGAELGGVVEQSVAAGETIPEAVELVVAGQGGRVPIDVVETISSGCYSDESSVNGQRLPESISCSLSTSSPDDEVNEYNLARDFDVLSVTLGLDDTSATGVPVRFRVLVDGAVAFDKTYSFGQSEAVTVPVTGALRLTLETSTSSSSDDYSQVAGVFGTPVLLTSPETADRYNGS